MPMLIALKGHPGAGKSAVARELGRRLQLPVIDKDDIKDVLEGACADPGGHAYQAMFNIAWLQLCLGLSVICDSPLSEPAGYTAAERIATETRAQLVVVECVCSSPPEWRRRIVERAAQGQATHEISNWEDLERHFARRRDSARYPIAAPHLIVDTLAPLEAVVERVLGWLNEAGYISSSAGGGSSADESPRRVSR